MLQSMNQTRIIYLVVHYDQTDSDMIQTDSDMIQTGELYMTVSPAKKLCLLSFVK
jgi:hypothetical protein